MDASYLFAQNFLNTKFEDLPAEVVAETRNQVLDFIGVALGGSDKSAAREIRQLYNDWGGKPHATVIGWGDELPAAHAAQVNATQGHSLDYDDVHEAATMHPGVVTITTALAIGEYLGGISGRDFIQAVAVGGDMISRLGLATRPGKSIHPFGWHFTTLGGFMVSAAVAGKLLGLDADGIVSAIGIGYHQCSGNGQAVTDGVLTKRMGPGFAVCGGIKAAFLAKMGVTGARGAIEGEKGFYRVYHGGDYSPERLTGELGKRWESANISIKPYPSCRGTHPFIDAAEQIRREHPFTPEEIEKIDIFCGKGTLGLLCEPFEAKIRPRNPVDAQFSVPWGVAVSLTRGRPGLGDYTDEAIADGAVLAAAAKIEVTNDPALDGTGLEPATVEVALRGGRRLSAHVELATGSPGNMLSYDDVVEKFRGCLSAAGRRLPDEKADGLVEFVRSLESAGDVRELFKCAVF
ncbi:MAG: MmgE/PrpD family protein [Oscillospiraceae bacterium]|jgi:2-methylcitrate dehydratase PrpD|nr:MmgE/PrpD family protein [Oscillospiraceae bacterium]